MATTAHDVDPTRLSERELADIVRANESGRQPVVFVHGLWLLASSWDAWRAYAEEHGYVAVAADWPNDPSSVAEARRTPEAFAGNSVGAVTDHVAALVAQLDRTPVLVGHSFGGLLVQRLAGMGLAATTVAIDPAPFRGVLPLPLSALKAASPVLGNPRNRGRAVTLTPEQFRYGFGSAVSAEESQELYDTFHVAAPGRPLFQAATANLLPGTEASVDTLRADRGPLLIISGEVDHIVPWAISNASFRRQARNAGVTEIREIPNRGHSLVVDSGWREVADATFAFVEQHAPAGVATATS